MSVWPSTRAGRVLRALLKIGWMEAPRKNSGSHRTLRRAGYPNFTWSFHESEEIGPKMLARIENIQVCRHTTCKFVRMNLSHLTHKV